MKNRLGMLGIVAMIAGLAAASSVRGAPRPIDGHVEAVRKAETPSAVVSAFAGGVAVDPRNAALHEAYLRRMVDLGVPEMAAHQAQILTGLDAGNGLAWGVMAFVYARRGQMPTAARAVARALKALPDDPFVLSTAGQLVAWYYYGAEPSSVPRETQQVLLAVRLKHGQKAAFTEGYLAGRDAYLAARAAGAGATEAAPPGPLPPRVETPQARRVEYAGNRYGTSTVYDVRYVQPGAYGYGYSYGYPYGYTYSYGYPYSYGLTVPYGLSTRRPHHRDGRRRGVSIVGHTGHGGRFRPVGTPSVRRPLIVRGGSVFGGAVRSGSGRYPAVTTGPPRPRTAPGRTSRRASSTTAIRTARIAPTSSRTLRPSGWTGRTPARSFGSASRTSGRTSFRGTSSRATGFRARGGRSAGTVRSGRGRRR